MKKMHITNYIPTRNKGVSILEHNQPKGIQPKMKGHKLGSGAN
jgi:hypothetical protein